VNEVYLRLVKFHEGTWQNRAHFFAVCAKLMRRILVDFGREWETEKRGGAAVRVPLEDALVLEIGMLGSRWRVVSRRRASAMLNER
jgi:hypothetical protein